MAKKTFEQYIQQIETIVKELESGELPLEKAIKKFEEGIKCTNYCSKLLDETERKISILNENEDDTIEEKLFKTNH